MIIKIKQPFRNFKTVQPKMYLYIRKLKRLQRKFLKYHTIYFLF